MNREAETEARRFFWGNTLRQALARAARQFQLAPEELAWRPVEKRHGFVKHPRRVLVEVDPAAPRREGSAPPASATSRPAPPPLQPPQLPQPPQPRQAVAPRRERGPEGGPAAADRIGGGNRPAPVRRPPLPFEPPVPPDEESAIAASVALAKLLRFAGLDLEGKIDRLADRLEIRLVGADEERLRKLGSSTLDALAYLLPRLVKSLSGRNVLCRIDGAGLRDAREEALRKVARDAAERVLATGEPVILDPLPPGDRRIVHMALADDTRLETESLGQGVEKRLRIAPTASPSTD
jgi:spoIIIJ-associated protein